MEQIKKCEREVALHSSWSIPGVQDEVWGSQTPGCCLTWTLPHGKIRTACRSMEERQITIFGVMLLFSSHQASHGLKIISSAVLSPRLWSRKLCQKAARCLVLGYMGQ